MTDLIAQCHDIINNKDISHLEGKLDSYPLKANIENCWHDKGDKYQLRTCLHMHVNKDIDRSYSDLEYFISHFG